ncbi:MAG: VOC family protein [Coriobacteriia bacterium]|nr:VOC family protein [Coriobacteriia bacterium]
MGRVVHFEIYTDETAKVTEFYRSVFGWHIESWSGPFEYHLVGTGPREQIGIDGAIAPFGVAGDQRVALTVDVPDLDDAIMRAVDSGAEVVAGKSEVPRIGWVAYMRDPGGTVFSMMQPMPEAAEAAGAGRDVWTEFGDSLRELGDTVSKAFSGAAGSPQAQRARVEAERAARGIRDASVDAADKARPHVISALDRVSVELGNLAARLRREEAGEATQAPPSSEGEGRGATGEGPAPPPDEY